ncbi:hypothetical protein CsSME_00042720 [Camellia sinensis var. sinensis]
MAQSTLSAANPPPLPHLSRALALNPPNSSSSLSPTTSLPTTSSSFVDLTSTTSPNSTPAEVCHIYFAQSAESYELAEEACSPLPRFVELPTCPVCLDISRVGVLLLVECMSAKNATNFCFCCPWRMLSKTCNFGLCYFEL